MTAEHLAELAVQRLGVPLGKLFFIDRHTDCTLFYIVAITRDGRQTQLTGPLPEAECFMLLEGVRDIRRAATLVESRHGP